VLSFEYAEACSGLEFRSQQFTSELIMLDKPHGEKRRSRRAKMARTSAGRTRPSYAEERCGRAGRIGQHQPQIARLEAKNAIAMRVWRRRKGRETRSLANP
jgi:hypothetical protein